MAIDLGLVYGLHSIAYPGTGKDSLVLGWGFIIIFFDWDWTWGGRAWVCVGIPSLPTFVHGTRAHLPACALMDRLTIL